MAISQIAMLAVRAELPQAGIDKRHAGEWLKLIARDEIWVLLLTYISFVVLAILAFLARSDEVCLLLGDRRC